MIEFSSPLPPLWLILLSSAAGLFVLWSYLSRRSLPLGRRIALGGLRVLILLLLVLCLLDPQKPAPVRSSKPVVLFDLSGSMGIEEKGVSRLQTAKNWWSNQAHPDARLFGFNDSLFAIADLSAAKIGGDTTRILDALDSLDAEASDCPAVVLISDGIDHSDKSLEATASAFRRKGVPIYTLTVGSPAPFPDIAVQKIDSTHVVPLNAETTLSVTLSSSGMKGQSVPLLLEEGGQVVAQQTVVLKDGNQKARLAWTPQTPGLHLLTVRIPVQPGERLTTNNSLPVALRAVNQKILVYYNEGSNNEYQYLKDGLEADPNIQVIAQQPYPANKEDLRKFDVIIISDITRDHFTQQQLEDTARYVEDEGAGFVMIGGATSFGASNWNHTPIDKIIPVAMENEKGINGGDFAVRLTPEALAHPIMAVGATPEETKSAWDKIPHFSGYDRVDRPKPGAIVLLTDPSSSNANGPYVILAVQEVGKGRSMAFTTDTTADWGVKFEHLWGEPINPHAALSPENSDNRYYRKFWDNAIRWLAANRLQSREVLQINLPESDYHAGESVQAQVVFNDPKLAASPDFALAVEEGPLEGATRSLPTGKPDADGKLPLTVRAGTPGTHLLHVTARQNGKVIDEDEVLFTVDKPPSELEDTTPNPEWMERLARLSGGEALNLKKNTLSALLKQKPSPVHAEPRSSPLWDRFYWLALLLGLISLEWLLRRKWNLV